MQSTLVLLAALLTYAAPDEKISPPKVLDARLKIELFAADPQIVTPTGLAIDSQGRVFVVECHTHFRPPDYQGPPADRIRVFVDRDGDGRAETISTFFEGTQSTMNIGINASDDVYVATRNEIFRLRDKDHDGVSDERTRIAFLETKGDYPHNGLSGFAFDFQGNLYFGLGENLGASFKLIGADNSIDGKFEGGQIYRCRPDGSKLEMVAFGFWNPFHVAFDTFERLFAVDNDPDSLPPCRLLHIVPGGNYGYRYRNGRRGVHPFTAWNGELPGTLPMVAGTGEAPSGILSYESDQLPADYVGDLLGTSWGDHRIERFHLEPRGASFQSLAQPIITGDEDFRPVGIACAPDGSLFISDWVSKSYNVHGQGRLWHVTAAKPTPAARPTDDSEAIRSPHRPLREAAARRLASTPAGRAQLTNLAAKDSTPRVRGAALMGLANAGETAPVAKAAIYDPSPDVRAQAVRLAGNSRSVESRDDGPEARAEKLRRDSISAQIWKLADDSDAFLALAAREALYHNGSISAVVEPRGLSPSNRLAMLLILREKQVAGGEKFLPTFLSDADPSVRFAAIQWVGEERLSQFRAPLEASLAAGPATARLFGGYLAALERLEGVVRTPGDEWAGEQFIVRALDDPATSPAVRRWSLRMLRADHPALTLARLQQFAADADPELRLEAIRTLRDCPHAGRIQLLRSIAADTGAPTQLRAEAVVGLSSDDADSRGLLLDLARNDDAALRSEALRSLRGITLNDAERERLAALQSKDDDTAELVERVVSPAARRERPEPSDLSAWTALLAEKQTGNAAAGQRIFFHTKSANCSRCHLALGRGTRVGPELTAGAIPAPRLLGSLLRPSQEIAPQFTSWIVVTHAGHTITGLIAHEEPTGEQTYVDAQGARHRLRPDEIETRRAVRQSIMPEDIAQQLTLQELRDLLAFLGEGQKPLH